MLSFLNSEEGRPLKENEYIDAEGIIHCSICKKPKQEIAEGSFGNFKHIVQCDCERKRAEEETKRLEQIERQQKIEKLTRRCFGNNQVLPKNTFENSELNNDAVKLCFNYCENWQEIKESGRSLILCGNVGSGKTFLACCICNKLIAEHLTSVRFITEYDYLNGYMSADKEKNYSKEKFLNEYTDCSLLVLDDFGTKCYNIGKPNGNGFLTYINDIIDARYKLGKPIVITTNLKKSLFLKEHSVTEEQRIFSRLKDMAGNPVEIRTLDLRTSRANAKTDYIKSLLNKNEK